MTIDRNTRRIAYAVLSVGSFSGLDEKLFAIPWSWIPDTKAFMLDVEQEALSRLPVSLRITGRI